MASKKPSTTIKIKGVNNSTVNATGRDVTKGVSGRHNNSANESDISIEIEQVENSNVDATGRDYTEYSASNFQALLNSAENILSHHIENQYSKEMMRIIHDVNKEKGKSRPDLSKVLALLKKLTGLISLANLPDPVKQTINNFVNIAKVFFHIS